MKTNILKSSIIFLFTFFVAAIGLASTKVTGELLTELFTKRPAVRIEMNPEIFYDEAVRTLGRAKADVLKPQLTSSDAKAFQAFMKIRSRVIGQLVRANVPPKESLPRIVISGQSVSGMYTAALAAQAGFDVTVYEKRDTYSREIQWSSRQAMADALAAIDPALAQEFVKYVAHPLKNGYGVVENDGSFHVYAGTQRAFEMPDPRRIPQTGKAMLAEPTVGTVEAKVMEKFLAAYTSKHPNITRYHGVVKVGELNSQSGMHAIEEYKYVAQTSDDPKAKYKEVLLDTPKDRATLIFVAEGVAGSTRKELGIQSIALSPARMQVAGVIGMEMNSEITTFYGKEGNSSYVAGSMGTKNSRKRWLVMDIPESVQAAIAATTDPAEKSILVENAFRMVAEKVMRLAPGTMFKKNSKGEYRIKVSGAIENQKLATFTLQQNISSRAKSGNNVFLLGDTVGNGHWSVGGGIHVAVISHGERLKKLLPSFAVPNLNYENTKLAAARYNKGAIEDSNAWAAKGTHYFYLDQSAEKAEAVFEQTMARYYKGEITNPQDSIQQLMTQSKPALLLCSGLF